MLGGDEADRIGMLVKVEDEAAVLGAFDRIEARLGPVSILVNNAARRPYEPLTTISRTAWTSVLDVILTGAFLTSRELFRRLPGNGTERSSTSAESARIVPARTGPT